MVTGLNSFISSIMAKTTRTIDDPIFGEVKLSLYDKGFQRNKLPFDPNQRMCCAPFTNLSFNSSGVCWVCCDDWSQYSVGKITSDTSALDIWLGPRVKAFRESILDNSYRYCGEMCPMLTSNNIEGFILPRKQIIERFYSPIPDIALSLDETCNLQCPSCRDSKITLLNSDRTAESSFILSDILESFFFSPHNFASTITFDTCGEVFYSKLYKHFFDNHPFFVNKENWPNVEFVITTNASMLTPKVQNKYHKILKDTAELIISLDAGNKDAYEKVRYPAKWEVTMSNVDYYYNTYMKNNPKRNSWRWNVILQKDNYLSIPDMIDLAERKYAECLPQIWITPILQWDHFKSGKYNYKDMAVWDPKHEDYETLLSVMNSPKVLNYKGPLNNAFIR